MWSHRVSALCIAPRLPGTGLWKTVADSEVELCNRRSRSRHSKAPAAPKPSRSTGLLEPSVALAARAEPSLKPRGASPAASSCGLRRRQLRNLGPSAPATAARAPTPPSAALAPWPPARLTCVSAAILPAPTPEPLPERFRVTAGPTRQGDAWRPRAGGRPGSRAGAGCAGFFHRGSGRRRAAPASLGIPDPAPSGSS